MEWVARYGLVAVFLGTFAEGETVLFGAGVLAARGSLGLAAVLVTAWAGAMAGHVFWFGAGRRWGRRVLAVLRVAPARIRFVNGLVARHPVTAIVLLQYLYGVRVAGAAILGVTTLPFRRFVLIEAVNCAAWAALVGGTGYVAGAAASQWFEGGDWWLSLILAVLVLVLVGRAAVRRVELRTRPTSRKSPSGSRAPRDGGPTSAWSRARATARTRPRSPRP